MRLEDLPDEADFCVRCGKRLPFDRYHGHRKYCSPDCRTLHSNYLECEGRREALEGRTCAECGAPLTRARTEQARYCSPLCQSRAWYEPKHPKTCRQCGTDFMGHHATSQFCSTACAAASQIKPPRPCAYCGKPFRNKPRVKTCSPSCGAKLRWKNRG